MNVLIAPDKFKGTLTAIQVCDYVELGLLKSGAPMVIRKLPLADGGEGTLDVFLMNTGGRRINVEVHDPLMRRCQAAYGLSGDGKRTRIVDFQGTQSSSYDYVRNRGVVRPCDEHGG